LPSLEYPVPFSAELEGASLPGKPAQAMPEKAIAKLIMKQRLI